MNHLTRPLVQIAFARPAAPLECREKLARWWDSDPCAGSMHRRFAGEVLVLRTCERFEIYMHTPASDLAQMIHRLARETGCDSRNLHDAAIIRRGPAAAIQLLRVASGLESAVLGEAQVLTQVRKAYLDARDARCIGPVLDALGRAAIHAGKIVRSQTQLTSAARSLAAGAIDRIADTSSVLVLGAGRVATDVLAELQMRGVTSVTATARRQDCANRLAHRYGAGVACWDDLAASVRRATAIITCTGAEDFLLGPELVTDRDTVPLTIIDLGVPRNVDPRVGDRPGVRLIHLDDLTPQTDTCPTHLRKAEAIINLEWQRFVTWLRGHAAARSIRRLLHVHAGNRDALHRRIVRIKERAA